MQIVGLGIYNQQLIPKGFRFIFDRKNKSGILYKKHSSIMGGSSFDGEPLIFTSEPDKTMMIDPTDIEPDKDPVTPDAALFGLENGKPYISFLSLKIVNSKKDYKELKRIYFPNLKAFQDFQRDITQAIDEIEHREP